ncbi:O-antigen polysaccharide polymerase Wzy [Flavobacterium sp. WV_118_3]|uniref:O-antigen polysaccharide polymerase Wzy n=1 Tax=Flavobacterium sp. WV_118_3 TaxID=3151764 RepID=UPI003219B9E7
MLAFNYIVLIVSLIISLLLMPDKIEVFDSSSNFTLSIISLVNVIVFWRTTQRFFTSWVRYDTLFLLGFLIVHFQIPLLASFGIEPDDPTFIWINKNVVNYATWFSTIAVLLWMLGFLWYSGKKRVVKQQPKYRIDTRKVDILLILSFCLFVVLVGKDFLGGGYIGWDSWGSGSGYAFILLNISIYLKIIYFFISYRNVKITKYNLGNILFKNKIFVMILGVYLLLFLFAGDRGPIMGVAVLILAAYSIYQKKIPFHVFFVMTLVGATIFTILSYGRSNDVASRKGNILQSGYETLASSEQTFNPTGELATSVRILYRALDAVPNYHPYLFGTTMISDAIGVIPFGSSIYMGATGLPIMYSTSSYFFTVLGQGNFFTYGEGSEIIADLYINLGFWGSIVLMLFFGYFIGFVTFNANFGEKHTITLVYLLLITGAIYINRSNFLDPLKMIVYALVIDRFLLKKIEIKKN